LVENGSLVTWKYWGVIMRKILLLLCLIGLIFNVNGFENIRQEYELNINTGSTEPEDFDIDAKFETDKYYDDIYTNFRLRIFAENDDIEAKFDRAYLSFSKHKYNITAGRQRIYWGLSQIFNYTDIFNEIDVADPEKDRTGVDALKIRYNNDFFSRIEVANQFRNGKDKFAARYTFVKDGFEYMFNYLDYENVVDNRDYIFEFKGDVKIGIWGQFIRKDKPLELNIIVLGGDYSFLHNDKTLYVMSEISLINKLDQELYYLGFSYTLDEFKNLNLSFTDSNSGKMFFGAGIDSVIDDYRVVSLNYKRIYNANPVLFPGLTGGHEVTATYNWSF